MRLTPVAGIFLHGPHFGDRYGIAHTLVAALEQAHIKLLALSCTISSISLIIRQHELAAAQVILGNTFAAPVECAPAAAGPEVSFFRAYVPSEHPKHEKSVGPASCAFWLPADSAN